MYGKFFVDNSGKTLFEGKYSKSEILSETLYPYSYPQLYWNHTNTDNEIEKMSEFITLMRKMTGEVASDITEEISIAEQRLEISLPNEIKALYLAVEGEQSTVLHDPKYFTLMDTKEIFVNNNVLAFAQKGKRKKKYIGLGLKECHLFFLDSKEGSEWEYEHCMPSFCEWMIETAAIAAINRMPVKCVLKLKGYPTRELKCCELLEKEAVDIWQRYEGYYNIDNAVLINEQESSVAWLRSTGLYSDIFIGAKSYDIIEKYKTIRKPEGISNEIIL